MFQATFLSLALPAEKPDTAKDQVVLALDLLGTFQYLYGFLDEVCVIEMLYIHDRVFSITTRMVSYIYVLFAFPLMQEKQRNMLTQPFTG